MIWHILNLFLCLAAPWSPPSPSLARVCAACRLNPSEAARARRAIAEVRETSNRYIYGKVNGVAAFKAIFYIHERVLQLHGPFDCDGNSAGARVSSAEKEAAAALWTQYKHEQRTPYRATCTLSRRAVPQLLQLQQHPLAVQAGRDCKVSGQSSQRVFL